ncbi:protein WVD2-like 7 isoform X2 [Macadamia integrifolia]|uniref:protein WVD2-like 7 isoform X2 n=1 Tax=Macadamia integrifolia TaxID=60698 RepID=UPI001C4F6468|nr:protein WVD2-like 7 isoform X2 [Macadamia integrifolia]
MEEPFNFRADSIHSGSISFGRFETEPLSWERWSSFSHNRYLEEAGKYSTPGSVTKKKAYFEAHFKKKALLHQIYTENQNSVEYQITENDILDHMNYMEEFEHDDDYAKALTNDNAVLDGDLQVDALLLTNDDTVLNGDLQDDASTLTYDDEVLDGGQHDVEPAEMHHTLNTLPLVKDEPEVELKDKHVDETKNVETLTRTSPAPKRRVALKDDSPSLKNSQRQTLKVKATTKTKTAKTKLMARVPRNISIEAPKKSTKNPRREIESLLRTKTDKTSVPKALQTACSLARTSKPEDPENLMEKLRKDNRSEKDLKVKKAGTKSQHSTLEKSEPKASQSADRPRRTVNSTNSDVKSASVIFHFKRDERAVKREEFHMKLEEKMHAKEAEINQIQAITQEEVDAEVKQLRKSLNFKATPMPSFYHEAAPRGLDGKKVVSGHVKSTKSQSKSPSPGCRVAGRPPPSPKAGSQQGLYAGESENAAARPQALEETDCLPTMVSEVSESTPSASTNKNCTSKVLKRSDSMGKKNIEKGKNCKQRGSWGSKLKEESIEGRRVVGAVGRSSGELVGKAMKRVGSKGVGGGSGMDHLAVGVAS